MDTKLATSNIKENILNVKSGGNTPLLLALKKGNVVVAEALLKQPGINSFEVDEHGLSALHWACMLRQDKIIEMLLEKNADPFLKTKNWSTSDFTEPFDFTPVELYQRQVLYTNFAEYYLYHEKIKERIVRCIEFPIYGDFIKKQNGYQWLGFVDRPSLHIPCETPYTDIIFHMKDLCTNLNWKQNETQFVHYNRSCDEFAENFRIGFGGFCKGRNAIPINKELLERMQKMQPKNSNDKCLGKK